METAALVAPFTALEFLQDAFLLTGEGPVLSGFQLHPQPKACASLSVLQHYRIHGIRPRGLEAATPPRSAATNVKKEDEPSSTLEPKFCDLAVFGGKAVRLVRFHVDHQDGKQPHFETLGPLVELQDWALDVQWLAGDQRSLLCVAAAHNSALLLDSVTGNVLRQRSCLEGCLLYSALLLVHESWSDAVLVGGTVFNQLVLWKPAGGGTESVDPELKAPVERRLLGHSGVIFSIAYLQEKGWLASASDDRSVRVWGVGALGGPRGNCGELKPACLRVLYGHQARVFSVRLSPGNVFSAGEDGACLVWDWTGGGKVVCTLKGHRAGGVRALAVSERTGGGERWVATGGADGGLRLWRMKPNEQGKKKLEDTASEQLTDLRFTGHGSPKVVCMVGEEDKHASWSQSKLVVCTDQGTVYQYSDRQWEIVWKGTPEFQSYCLMETTTVSLKDSVMCLCAVGNLSGSIQVFPISHPQCGVRLTGGTGKIHSLIWRETKDGIYLLASGSEGLVFRWLIEVPSQENAPSSLRVNPLPSFLLPRGAKRWLTAAVRVHANAQGGLWVCGDRRGSLLLFQDGGTQEAVDHRRPDDCPLTGRKPTHRHEVEERAPGGDRKSERKEVADSLLQPLSCLFGVHGKLGVTSVSEHQGLLYSTGRDGCVRVFRLILVAPQKREGKSNGNSVENNGGLQLEVLRVQRACKGMEWLERVLILDSEISAEEEDLLEKEFENHYKTTTLAGKMEVTGAREEKERFKGEEENTEDNGREARFAIIGFHAVHFVVWDPVRQQRLFAVPCGGGHRSWRLWPSHRGGGGVWPGYGALVFIKQGAVMASRPPGEASGRAGEVGRYEGWGLREGVHGRGIGCVCRLGAITGIISDVKEAQRGEERWEIVATGGEDTSLTVLALRPSCGRVKVLSVITDHISSVRTLTAVTGPGGGREDQALSALLVSAGGRAQMQCYRLRVGWDRRRLVPSCQVIQVASHRLDEQWERRRNRHKTVKMDPETRYMSVVAVDEKTDGCLLAVACSDGAVRLFSVSEVKHQIDLLWETFYHQRCVLSVAACSLQDRKCNKYKLLFSAATDGQIAVWDLTDASSLWTGASSRSPTAPIPCFSIHAHQSGVNSLAVRADNLGPPEYGCRVTVASGGDDGQLTVSMIRVQYPNDSPISEPLVSPQAQFRSAEQLHLSLDSQCRIPLAHASPLTALKLLSQNLVVSTSSDQRVCLWRVGSTDISHIGALCCHVADAAGLAVWEGKLTEEEEDKHKKTGLQSEREIAIRPGGPAGLNETHQTAARFNKDQETNDVGVSETGDPVCQTSNEGGGETERRHQRGADSSGETESEVNTERGVTASWESRGGKTGWVLVCGHGFQLLRVPNAEGGSSRREKQQEDQSLASREKSK